MNMCTFLRYATAVCFLLIYLRQCDGSCSQGFTGFREVLTCLTNITHGINEMNVLAGTTTATVQKYCQNGSFNDTVKCLTNLYGQCRNQRGEELLKRIAKPYIWQQGIRAICNNLHEHANYSDCIVQQRPEIYKCLNHNDLMFLKNTELATQTLQFNYCRYYKGIKICTGEPVRENCDNRTGELLMSYIHSITPLLCFDTYTVHGSGRRLSTACDKLICVTVLLTLFNCVETRNFFKFFQ